MEPTSLRVEYRVRPVTRHIVTRYACEAPDGASTSPTGASSQHGEFDNYDTAYAVAYALASAEHQRLGYPLDDMRIIYPQAPEASAAAPTYREMSAPDMLKALGDDAAKWAAAFRELHPELDEGELIGWFANAIESSSDLRRSRLIHDDEAWADFNEQIGWQRRCWRDAQKASAPQFQHYTGYEPLSVRD